MHQSVHMYYCVHYQKIWTCFQRFLCLFSFWVILELGVRAEIVTPDSNFTFLSNIEIQRRRWYKCCPILPPYVWCRKLFWDFVIEHVPNKGVIFWEFVYAPNVKDFQSCEYFRFWPPSDVCIWPRASLVGASPVRLPCLWVWSNCHVLWSQYSTFCNLNFHSGACFPVSCTCFYTPSKELCWKCFFSSFLSNLEILLLSNDLK